MRMREFTGNIPQTSINFRCLQKKSNVQEKSQTGEDNRLVVSPPIPSTETVQNLETDTSPVKTMTVLQIALPGTNINGTNSQSKETVLQEIVNLERSVGSRGGTDVSVYCEDKLRSLSEGEIQTLMEVSEESIAKVLACPTVCERIFYESIPVDAVGDLEERSQKYLRSIPLKPLKSASAVGNVAESSKLRR